MSNTFFILILILAVSFNAHAQFRTISKGQPVSVASPYREKIRNLSPDSISQVGEQVSNLASETDIKVEYQKEDFAYLRKRVPRSKLKQSSDMGMAKNRWEPLPPLTIPNLIREIRLNGILFPDVVLAQAILETGWFTSSVCRNKHNLFGLTNPRTGTYYEFSHWTESVRAYRTKVQYKYKGGDYLRWLNKIGYAEAKDYVHCLIGVMRQLRRK